MLINNFSGDFDYWLLDHKVTFDGIARTITVNPGVSAINIQIDIYSDWKEWLRMETAGDLTIRKDTAQFTQALRAIGGDPTTGGEAAGDIYFLINNWQIILNERVTFTGAIFSDNFTTPFIVNPGGGVESIVSSLVTRIIPTLTDQDLVNIGELTASAVWNALLEDFLLENSFGEYVQAKLLKKTTFIALN